MNQLGRLVFTLLLAGAAAAAEVRLGPEVPLAPADRDLVPAAYSQLYPAVATDGWEFVAVWRDAREERPPTYPAPVYMARLDANGAPLQAARRVLGLDAAPFPPSIASNGVEYLVASGHQVQRIDRDGNPIGAPLDLGGEVDSLASDGRTYLAIVRTGDNHYSINTAHRISSDGVVLQKISIPGKYLHDLWRADADGDSYLVIEECPISCDEPVIHSIGESGEIATIALPLPRADSREVAAGGPWLAAAWTERAPEDLYSYTAMYFALFDRDGTIVKAPAKLDVPARMRVEGLWWDGSGYVLLAWYPGEAGTTPLALRISAGGTVEGPLAISQTAVSNQFGAAFASNRLTGLLLWSDTRFSPTGDVVAKALNLPGEPRLLAQSERSQTAVRVAVAQSHVMAVYYSDSNREIGAVIDGKELFVTRASPRRIGPPGVAASEDRFLVAWQELTVDQQSVRLLAQRYATDGTLLDAQPVVLASRPAGSDAEPVYWRDLGLPLGATEVVANRTSFLVPFAGGNAIHMVHVDAATGVASTDTLGIPDGGVSILGSAATGSTFLVSYCGFNAGCAAVRIDAGGRIMGQTKLEPLYGGSNQDFAAAPGRMTVIGGYYVNTLDDSGHVVNQGGLLPESGPNAIAWNGSEYVVVWTSDRVRAMRFSADGKPLDAQPFDVSPPVPRYTVQPSVTATADGVVIAYHRPDDAHTGVPRAYMRTLARLPQTIMRRPSVRH